MQQLFQENPKTVSSYIPRDKHGNPCKNRSLADSKTSYQNGACKETLLLRRNGRVPTKELVLHFLQPSHAEDIREDRTEIFSVLAEHGLEAVANLELTKDKHGKPNNCVHSHILTDDQRSESELVRLLEMACKRQGLVKDRDFCITSRELWDGYRYFAYYTKYGKQHFDKVLLFEKGLLNSGRTLQKFYQIGKWFGETKGQLWEDIKTEMRNKENVELDHPDSTSDSELAERTNCYLSSSEPAQKVSCDNKVPMKYEPSIAVDRAYLREKYGINLDTILEGNAAVTEFDYPGIGKFYKHANLGWIRVENGLSNEQDVIPTDTVPTNCYNFTTLAISQWEGKDLL